MTGDANHPSSTIDVTGPPMPRWARILRWVNVVSLLLWIGLLLVALVWASATVNDSAFGLSVLLVAPALVALRFAPVVVLLIVLLIAGTAVLVIVRRGGMTIRHAVSIYSLVAWTTFWVVMWVWTLGMALIG